MEEGAKLVCSYFEKKEPFLIGRNGSTELEVITYYMNNGPDTVFPEVLMNCLETYSGIFPPTQDSVRSWVIRYIDSLKECDVIAEGWYEPRKTDEKILLNAVIPNRDSIFLRNLEPYYFEESIRWSKHLEKKDVGIINSFATISEEQTYVAKAVWGSSSETLLPSSTRWIPIKTYFPPKISGDSKSTSWPSHIKSWEDAVEEILKSYEEDPFQVAIIGCGALGMIIGAELKKRGVQVILMGGATQILFGIRGKRWDTNEIISNFFNDAWIYPTDKPMNASLIENECYW
jgi:hypothetical protein